MGARSMNSTILIAAALVYGLGGLVTIVAYRLDKRAATRGRRRIRERTLHLLEVAGGCLGGLIARPLLRHKTRDARFRVVSWLILALHAGAWAMAFWLIQKR